MILEIARTLADRITGKRDATEDVASLLKAQDIVILNVEDRLITTSQTRSSTAMQVKKTCASTAVGDMAETCTKIKRTKVVMVREAIAGLG